MPHLKDTAFFICKLTFKTIPQPTNNARPYRS